MHVPMHTSMPSSTPPSVATTDGWRPVEATAAAWTSATLAAAPGRPVLAAAGAVRAIGVVAAAAAAVAAAGVEGLGLSGAAGVEGLGGWVAGVLVWSPVCWLFVWFPWWLLWCSLSAPMLPAAPPAWREPEGAKISERRTDSFRDLNAALVVRYL